MEIKIKCPTCGKILRLMDSPTINTSTFKCPVCGEKHTVGNCQRVVVKPKQATTEETQYGSAASRQPSNEETQYAGYGASVSNPEETRIYSAPTPLKVGTLVDNTGRTYMLQVGINTIGRQASTSSATVQIATSDRTMSRSHAIVEVHNAGGQIVHILKNGANKNPSHYNGTLIESTDQFILNNGDKVKFGSTELTFKK